MGQTGENGKGDARRSRDPDPDGADDPAQAFEELRAEVSALRRAVEALPAAWHESRPPNYSPDLGRLTKGLAVVSDQLDGIARHPDLGRLHLRGD